MRTEVRRITERETGGVLKLAELCTKIRERVMEVLQTKHLDERPPTAASLDTYPDRQPEIVPVYITNDTVTAVAGRLSGEAGLGGTDQVILHHWLLRFGVVSGSCI